MLSENLPPPKGWLSAAVTFTLDVLAMIQWQAVAITVGTIAGTLVALATAWKLPVVNRPLKWLFERNVAQPLGTLLNRILDKKVEDTTLALVTPIAAHLGVIERQMTQVLIELRPNSGKSFRDELHRFQRITTEDINQLREGQMLLVEVINAKRMEYRRTDPANFDTGVPGVAWDAKGNRIVTSWDDPYWRDIDEAG